MSRFIGIRHRVKKTAAGEARPTQVAVLENSEVKKYDLEDETAELDFLKGCFPVKMRPVTAEDAARNIPRHLIVWREVKDGKSFTVPLALRKLEGEKWFEAAKVPEAYEGFRSGDVVAMALGGSGDRFAFGLSRRGEEIGAKVLRITGYLLKAHRDRLGADKDDDAEVLTRLVQENSALFHEVVRRDRDMIAVREALKDRVESLRARMAADQRFRQRLIGRIFCSDDGRYPEGNVEDLYQRNRADNTTIRFLEEEERRCVHALEEKLVALPVYEEVFKPIKGCGPLIAAPIIAAITDIRRFSGKPQIKAFCGVHVRRDGTFPRQRRERGVPPEKTKEKDQLSTDALDEADAADFIEAVHDAVTEEDIELQEPKWNRAARQAVWLLVSDQFNRRPDSEWGKKLLHYKEHFRRAHPEVQMVENKRGREVKRYTDGHIHKMAIWRTATKFVEYIFREWSRVEREYQETMRRYHRVPRKPSAPPSDAQE